MRLATHSILMVEAVLAGALAGGSAARAQTPAAVPETMPFDIPYGAPISLDDAQKAVTAAATEARKHNWKMAVTVVDPAGNLVAHATMDGTQYASIPIAQAKARTAALFRRASGMFQAAINTGGSPSSLSLLAVTGGAASEGGFPIVIGGKLVGAIGASGGIFTQDAVTAKAGLDAVTGSGSVETATTK
ncbi:MAG TPA: heme-binding protein [Rhodopila sp.]